MSENKPTYKELEVRLAKAEAVIQAIREGEADVVIGTEHILSLELKETRDALRKAHDELEVSLKEKEVLLKEIHHRVRNNLQLISSMLALQSDCIENEEVLDIFKTTQSRIRTIYLIHENLYKSPNMSQINFEIHIQTIVQNLYFLFGVSTDDIPFKMNVDDIYLDINRAVPCGLIINELVTNSLKYAFPQQKGELRIELSSDNNHFCLIISDNGIGFPVEFDLRKIESLGLAMTNDLVKQLHGTIELDKSKGTTFKILF